MACPLTTPAFHFCFALIRAALTRAITASTSSKSKSPMDESDDETLSPIMKGLAVINEHAMLRGNASDEEVEVSCLSRFSGAIYVETFSQLTRNNS